MCAAFTTKKDPTLDMITLLTFSSVQETTHSDAKSLILCQILTKTVSNAVNFSGYSRSLVSLTFTKNVTWHSFGKHSAAAAFPSKTELGQLQIQLKAPDKLILNGKWRPAKEAFQCIDFKLTYSIYLCTLNCSTSHLEVAVVALNWRTEIFYCNFIHVDIQSGRGRGTIG